MDRCTLCPRACGARRAQGERGVCGADGAIRIARAALHYWEEPPISGEEGSGTVFFSHCPLHCLYCQNAGIANGSVGAEVSVRRLAQIFLEQQERGAMNVNLVTATHYAPQVLEALRLARAAGLALPVVWNTSGYETVQTIELLAPAVDVFLTDYRYIEPATARAYSQAPNYPSVALCALRAMAKTQADIIVRILVLPGHLEEAKRTVAMLHQEFGGRVTLSMMSQYTPMGRFPEHPELERTVSPEEFEELLDFADSIGCDEYFWQEGEAAQESFIPPFDTLEGVLGPELPESVSARA